MHKIFTPFLLLFSLNLFAQTGKIVGKITSNRSGEPLIGATITIEGTSRTVVTDLNGNYSISGLTPKKYALVVSYISYAKRIVDDITVKAGEVVIVNVSLEDQKGEPSADVVIIRTRATAATTSALLSAQKNSASVSDGISADQIRKTPDRNTSDVLKRVSGASIQNDRFAIIRGLNDRYNAAFINGAPLPSSESDRKAFAFDIFPSTVLDNLVIYKTATPDMTGDFVGGVINISTKSIPAKNFTEISFGTGHNSLATFKEKVNGHKGKYDYLGLVDDSRKLPADLPSSKDFATTLTFEQKAAAAKLFGGYEWGLDTGKAGPNFNFQITKGLNIGRKGKEFLGVIAGVTYTNRNSYTESDRNSFDYDISGSAVAPIRKGKYTDKNYANETLLGILANVSAKITPKSTISWKNLYSINSDNRIIIRDGFPDYDADSSFRQVTSARWFTSNQIFSSQLIGDHAFGRNNSKLSWLGSYSNVKREIPNLSQFIRVGYGADLQPLLASGASISQTNGTNMFFSTNNEEIYSFRLDATQPFKWMGSKQNFLKAGINYQKRERDFNARLLGFQPSSVANHPFDYDLLKLRENKIFRPENLGVMANGKGGFALVDGNLPTFTYDANAETKAAYLMADQRFFTNFRLVYGVRVEEYVQKLNSFKDFNKPTNTNTTVRDYLPSVNFVYAVSPKQNIRLSYSKTVNRPEFRELAPFLFYDFVAQYTIEGFDTLKRAEANNYDFRYEFFPGRSQLFSVSGFYKTFTNPIEIVSNPDFDNLAIYSNSKSATVYGFEAEFRTLLSTVTGAGTNSFLNDLTFSANAAFMWSKVKLGRFGLYDLSKLVTNRSLQGQSPYIINSSLSYANENIGLSSTLSYNRVGPRIFIAGTLSDANIYEQTRDVVDFQLAKSFLKNKLEIRLNARDILAQNVLFYFDFNQTKKYEADVDKPFNNQIMPRVITLAASYKF